LVDAFELALGLFLLGLELGDTGGLFEDDAAFLGVGLEEEGNAALFRSWSRHRRRFPVSRKSSRMSLRRVAALLSWYSLVPSRKSRRPTETSSASTTSWRRRRVVWGCQRRG